MWDKSMQEEKRRTPSFSWCVADKLPWWFYTRRESKQQFRVVYKYAGEGKAEAEKRIEPEPITARTREKEEQT